MCDIAMPARMSDEEMIGFDDVLDCSVEPGLKPVLHSHRQNLRNRFELGKTLGEGMYGKVKLAVEKATVEQVIKFTNYEIFKFFNENKYTSFSRYNYINLFLYYK